jgi:hypothetical protein
MSSSSLPTEAVKELMFGGTIGLCSGLVAKRLSMPVLAGMASVVFLFFRAAIFDGRLLVPWSPLQIDDTTFASDLIRKARRESLSDRKRMDLFIRENFLIFSGFGGACLLSQAM